MRTLMSLLAGSMVACGLASTARAQNPLLRDIHRMAPLDEGPTMGVGLEDLDGDQDLAAGDVDGDQDADFVTAQQGLDRLYVNQGVAPVRGAVGATATGREPGDPESERQWKDASGCR